MFTDEFLEKLFLDPELRQIPIGCQSTAIHVFESILFKMVKENRNATLSELFMAE